MGSGIARLEPDSPRIGLASDAPWGVIVNLYPIPPNEGRHIHPSHASAIRLLCTRASKTGIKGQQSLLTSAPSFAFVEWSAAQMSLLFFFPNGLAHFRARPFLYIELNLCQTISLIFYTETI